MGDATAAPARLYRGMDADQRQAARRERLLEAGLELLGTKGWQATTVTAICEEARLTPRYFYESFRDRDELLVAVFNGVMQDVANEVIAAFAATPPDLNQTLHVTVSAFVKIVTDDRRKGRIAFVEALGSEALMRQRRSTSRGFAQVVAAQARAAYKVSASNVHAIELASLIVAGGLIETMVAWLDGGLQSSAEEVINDYTKLCLASLEAAIPLNSIEAS